MQFKLKNLEDDEGDEADQKEETNEPHKNHHLSLSSPASLYLSLSLPLPLLIFGANYDKRTDPLSDPTTAKAPLVIGERIGLEEYQVADGSKKGKANLGLRRFPLLGIQINSDDESTLKY